VILRGHPLYRATDAAVGTGGVAFAVHATGTQPVTTHQVKVKVIGGLAFVGVGRSSSPPAPTVNNSAYIEDGETLVMSFDGNPNYEQYVYVYAETGTVLARVSRFG
jgi:hypothetical protein